MRKIIAILALGMMAMPSFGQNTLTNKPKPNFNRTVSGDCGLMKKSGTTAVYNCVNSPNRPENENIVNWSWQADSKGEWAIKFIPPKWYSGPKASDGNTYHRNIK